MKARLAYDYAVLRAVPHPHLEWWVPVGVIVHSRTAGFLAARALDGVPRIRDRVPELDAELLGRYLQAWVAIAGGRLDAGPIALLPPSERFHWLTAPRSDVLQPSTVRAGLCDDPAQALEMLWRRYVEPDVPILPSAHTRP